MRLSLLAVTNEGSLRHLKRPGAAFLADDVIDIIRSIASLHDDSWTSIHVCRTPKGCPNKPVMVVEEKLVEECTMLVSRVQEPFTRVIRDTQANGRYVLLNPPQVVPACAGLTSKSLSLVGNRLEVQYSAMCIKRISRQRALDNNIQR